MSRIATSAWLALALLLTVTGTALAEDDARNPLIAQLTPTATFADSTVPPNGDLNPYGVAIVPHGFSAGGPLHPGDIIVSNFNASSNVQGTGTTIVRVNNGTAPTVFFQGESGLGLTTALGVLRAGYVLVGNLPTDSSGNALRGSLLVIDKHGKLVKQFVNAKLLDGPWNLTVKDEGHHAKVFVSNVLSGTVTRLDLRIAGDGDGDRDDSVILEKETQIASGYAFRTDPSALVVGPTGVALDAERDILYVSSTGDNAIFAVRDASDRTTDAGMGQLVVKDDAHLHGPLGLALAPNGDLISTQGDAVNPDASQPSEIVEFTRSGQFVAQFSVDPAPGSAFGLAIRTIEDGFIFATVDDATNVLDIWVVK